MVVIVFALLASSCSIDILPKNETEVHIIGVALDYFNVGSNLQGTINDVTEFITAYEYYLDRAGIAYDEQFFIQQGVNPDIHHEEYPDAENITEYIENLEVAEDDLILFVYSGHGTYDPEVEKSAIVLGASETDPLPLFYVDELFDLLDSKGCQAAAVIDCCNSGGMAEDWYDDNEFVAAFSTLVTGRRYRGLHVITACAVDQLSYEYVTSSGEYHGEFTNALLNCMGWAHASVVARTIDVAGETVVVRGSMITPLTQPMSFREFYLTAITDMDQSIQNPQTNRTTSDLLFIK